MGAKATKISTPPGIILALPRMTQAPPLPPWPLHSGRTPRLRRALARGPEVHDDGALGGGSANRPVHYDGSVFRPRSRRPPHHACKRNLGTSRFQWLVPPRCRLDSAAETPGPPHQTLRRVVPAATEITRALAAPSPRRHALHPVRSLRHARYRERVVGLQLHGSEKRIQMDGRSTGV